MNSLYYTQPDARTDFLQTRVPKYLLTVNVIMAVVYFLVITLLFPKGNTVLFVLLIAGQIYHVWQLLTFLFTIWDTEYMPPRDDNFRPPVDVFITVAGEPVEIVEQTVTAAKQMTYPNFRIHILNDGYVAKKENYSDIEKLAERLRVNCITRKIAGGAKAGNINNAIRQTSSPYFAVLDTDHVPHPDFLQKMMGYFIDKKMAFVQSPQYYKNNSMNQVTAGSWEQQALFFGPICKGKNRLNAVTMCGTNMVIRRKAILEVGGMCEDSIAEDFVTGMFLHEKGWKSTYVPEVLCEGLAPEDFMSYYKQQHRWARGALDLIFKYHFPFRRGLTLSQKVQYLSSAGFFVSGLVVIMNAALPLIFFYTGLVALQTSTMLLAAVFIPYILITLYVLQASVNFCYSFRSLAFSMGGFNIHTSALWAALTGRKTSFAVTSKKKVQGNFVGLVIPHIIYVVLVAVGIAYAILRDGLVPSVITNFAWAVLNTAIFTEFIGTALPNSFMASSEFEVRKRPKAKNIVSGSPIALEEPRTISA
jgi:cellulose synthase (UDP-forming)